MDVVTYADSAKFLEASREFRAREPYLTNVIGSVAQSVVAGRRYDSCHWWAAIDNQTVVGIAMRTLPYNLMVSPASEEANVALGAVVAETFPDLPGMSGPLSQAAAYQVALGARSAKTTMSEVVCVLKDFVRASAPGAARRPTDTDSALMRTWLEAFAREAQLPTHDMDAAVLRMMDIGWLWECDDEPVAMGGYAGPVGDAGSEVGRIGPVYTAPNHRRRGFGAAITSAVIEQLLPLCQHIMLYADAANPTSNGVYQRLGFVEYAHTGQVAFEFDASVGS